MKTKKLPLHNNKWVRRIHAWAGFATLALLLIYGLTGLWLQHRAVLPLPGPHTDKRSEVLTLTAPLSEPAALTILVQQHYSEGLEQAHTTVTPPQHLPTPSGPLILPARWELKAVTLSQSLAASYVAGTLEVRIERQQANFAASLNRLHRGMGTGLPWQLFGDLAALALLLLALTSLLMWNKLHGPPRRGIALLLAGALATLLIALL
ncbi:MULTISPECIES: PepSY-associated TM helix domain-containing protein [Aeromonas]|uniref:PepSY-associated TM helix domain-containing protein n=1 Tax=Aeromonas TaxID=642 RepID=UPI00051CA3C0|nr:MULTISPECIES: PepSY-associated TM helix domain-containing protein [Aeromonas]MCH7370931.1 PepSY-associated TM helix domain-containing protein [Aeromonas sp. MR16]